MEENKSQGKCIVIINDKEYKGSFYKFNKIDNFIYLLISEHLENNDKISNNKIDIIYNNKKKEMNLNERIFENFNKNNKKLICIEILYFLMSHLSIKNQE